jgi:O-antigen/teichoic acid export membrane protein
MADAARKHDDEDLGDLLQEMRVLLQGAQVLTAFLVILPFNQRFADLSEREEWVYVATFVLSVFALVLFSAPAAHHRLVRPLQDRERFKNSATRFLIGGLVAISLALILATQLVVSQVLGVNWSFVFAGGVGLCVVAFWWIYPWRKRQALSARR